MFFTAAMNKIRFYIYLSLAICLSLLAVFSNSDNDREDFSQTVKVALRATGNDLLLSNSDSTSLVAPILQLSNAKYELQFESDLSIEPGVLTQSVNTHFEKAELPRHYIVEVLECQEKEVAYSYKVVDVKEKDIIPCRGRVLPSNCYRIQVRFSTLKTPFISNITILLLGLCLGLVCLFDIIWTRRKTQPDGNSDAISQPASDYQPLGLFRFYPQEHKLIKEPVEISLSKKECELLEILAANINQVVTRDDLTKRVWEDNGVIVGRSLDTYISKLRKKLAEDSSIKITNVHGVGYKLEIVGN